MADVLIRDIPDAVLTAIDAHASKLGLSRSEYLRRRLSQDARRSDSGVTADDLRGFARMFKDLNDPEVMAGAWS